MGTEQIYRRDKGREGKGEVKFRSRREIADKEGIE